MSQYEYTPKAMAEALKTASEKLDRAMARGNAPPSDRRYLVGAIQNAVEALEWISEYSAAIEKAAKNQVPWRSSSKLGR